MKNKEKYYSVAWAALIIAAWETASRAGWVNQYILPPFSKVVLRAWKDLLLGELGLQILNSLKLILIGCAISLFVSSVFTIMATRFKIMNALFNTLCAVFNPLPGVALLPLIMMWFGIGNTAMIVLIVHGVVWPLTNSLISGYRSMPPVYREFAENFNIKSVDFFFKILIFSILSDFLNGLRIGWGRAWRALISAEMIFGTVGSFGGVGYYIYTNRVYADITGALAGSAVIVFIGIIVEKVFKLLEDLTVVRWGVVHD